MGDGAAPASTVPAPPASPPRISLVSSAFDPQDGPDVRWEGGVLYAPETCGRGGVGRTCAPAAKTFDPDENPATVEFTPFFVWAGDRCSSFGYLDRDWIGRATRALAAVESYHLARELWTGDLASDEGWANRSLASPDSDVLTDGPTGLTDAMACLESYAADCSKGQRGMIHAPRQMVTHWDALNLLRREGNLIVTINDTIVVPDAGYDGSGPEGQDAAEGSVWAYVTGVVSVRRGPIDVIPSRADDLNALLRDAMLRDDNTVEIRAERTVAATWDGCCHGAVEVNMSLCGFGGPGS